MFAPPGTLDETHTPFLRLTEERLLDQPMDVRIDGIRLHAI